MANKLPPELVEVIIGFVLRPDWRTCCRPVADLIQENNELVSYYIVERRDYWWWSEESYDEIDEWTLYGRTWLMNAHTNHVIDQRRAPLIPPEDRMYTDDYWKWYSHRIQWMN